ncbi:hypothetical protein [Paenibacillus sp. J2TS4]|uniref:hypothetical protein n=1 Tax=Paenibacillus sp. J2TS4 TaxID=2807194 RepID=UPI001BCF3424|nr:hypothetical protein [Paenibacillus sp. J2TS4]
MGRTAAVLSISGHHPLLHSVLDELQKLSLNEIILVLRCKDDALSARLLSHSSSPVIVCEELENDDQARAAGARISSSDIILFLYPDRVIPADHLVQLIFVIASGADLALRDRNRSAFHRPFHIRNEDTVIREFVRMTLGRKDIEAHTLSVLPYALSRTAVERIGYDRLAEPFHALTDAIRLEMNIQSLASDGLPQISEEKQGELRINGLLASLRAAMDLRGPRLRFRDSVRLRRYTRGES